MAMNACVNVQRPHGVYNLLRKPGRLSLPCAPCANAIGVIGHGVIIKILARGGKGSSR